MKTTNIRLINFIKNLNLNPHQKETLTKYITNSIKTNLNEITTRGQNISEQQKHWQKASKLGFPTDSEEWAGWELAVNKSIQIAKKLEKEFKL